jgi:ubiquinone/menaquinone biosynthesis C-methylase UbiE
MMAKSIFRPNKQEKNPMKKSTEYFAQVAKKWDQLRSGYFNETIRDDAIAKAQLTSHDIVADVGTGTGFMINGLAPLVAKVYGFDESPEMLNVARRNLAAFNNVELKVAQGNRLPIPDGSFDAVFANMYLHHTPDPPHAVAELARVLRPGGRLILIDVDAHDQEWMREEMADRWLGFQRNDVRAWYTTANLTDISITCAKGNCHPTSPEGKKLALSIFVAYGVKM